LRDRLLPSGGRRHLEATINKIYILVAAAIGALLLIEGSSWGKLHVANCGVHKTTRCHVIHHNNHYAKVLRGNIYGQASNDGRIGSSAIYATGASPFYYGTDPDSRIVFELHRDPGWAR